MTANRHTAGGSGRRRLVALPLVLALALLTWQPPARSLSCVPSGPLLPLDPRAAVVLGEILVRQADGSVMVRVVEVLQGSTKPPALPRGSTYPAGLPRLDAGRTLRLDSRQLSYWTFGRLPFPTGSRWIFQLVPVDRQAGGFDAGLSPCIEPPPVIQGVVQGWLFLAPGQPRLQTMTLRELRRRIRAGSGPTP